MRRNAGAGLVALAILASGAIRLRLLDLPLERDEGGYATVAQLLLAGVPPYAEAYEMRMPGVFLAYALFLGTFGESAEAIRIGLALSNAASAVLLYLLGRRIADETTGASAAVLFAATSLAASVLGLAANTEHFVLLPAIAGLCVLAAPVTTGRAFWGGCLLGLALLTKQTAAPLVACGVVVAWLGVRERGRASTRAALACAAAACLPALVAALALVVAGSFEAFWFWTVVYPLTYAAAPPPGAVAAALREGLPRVLGTTAPLWLLAGAGGVTGLRSPRLRRAARLALLWLAFAAAAVAAGQRFRPQHFLLLLPPGALLAGLATSALAALPCLRAPAALRTAQVGVVGVALVATLWGDREILFRMDSRAASRALHGANPFPEAREIALWLREHASPGDRVAVLGSEPQIYFYSRLRPATPYLHAYEMVQDHAYAARMQQDVIERLEASPPRFVVFVNMGISWHAAPGAENRLLAWVRERMPLRYVQVGQVNLLDALHTDYFWGDAARTAPRSPRGWIAIWERQAKRSSKNPVGQPRPGDPASRPRPARRPRSAARR